MKYAAHRRKTIDSQLNTKPALVVLAAGMGSRFGGLKQILPVGPSGETLLEYAIYDAGNAGFGKVVIVIKSTFERVFCERILPRLSGRTDVHYVLQDRAEICREDLWGTGCAILAVEERIDESFAVINADDYYGHNVFIPAYDALQERRHSRNGSFFLVSYELGATLSPNGPVSRGICTLDGSRLVSVIEHTRLELKNGRAESVTSAGEPETFDLATPVSMNFWGFTPDLFDRLRSVLDSFVRDRDNHPDREFRLPDAVCQLVSAGSANVEVIPAGEKWFGITYQADQYEVSRQITKLVDAGTYPNNLWAK